MTRILSLILSGYCLLLLSFLVGWIRTRRQLMPHKTIPTKGMSIVVALRNEEGNVNNLLGDLRGMVFPLEKFEIILVNDHSTDATEEKVMKLIQEIPNARLFNLPDKVFGKKEALRFGIELARFEIIATTDGDCCLSNNWLACISTYFEQDKTKMVVGAVKFSGDHSFFARLQMTEFVSLIGSTAAAIGLGKPILCNGANLAYLKSAFNEVDGYRGNLHIASGDDEFLMRKIERRYPGGIRFLNYDEATVITHPQRSLGEFYHQRIRWAGKWRHNRDVLTQLLALVVFTAQLAFVGLVIHNLSAVDVTLGLVMAKLFLEGVLMYWAGRFLHHRFDILAFLTLQITYPFYVAVIGMFSLFSPYAWKGRNYR